MEEDAVVVEGLEEGAAAGSTAVSALAPAPLRREAIPDAAVGLVLCARELASFSRPGTINVDASVYYALLASAAVGVDRPFNADDHDALRPLINARGTPFIIPVTKVGLSEAVQMRVKGTHLCVICEARREPRFDANKWLNVADSGKSLAKSVATHLFKYHPGLMSRAEHQAFTEAKKRALEAAGAASAGGSGLISSFFKSTSEPVAVARSSAASGGAGFGGGGGGGGGGAPVLSLSSSSSSSVSAAAAAASGVSDVPLMIDGRCDKGRKLANYLRILRPVSTFVVMTNSPLKIVEEPSFDAMLLQAARMPMLKAADLPGREGIRSDIFELAAETVVEMQTLMKVRGARDGEGEAQFCRAFLP